MKPKDKILTYDQAKELQWFCKNCTGLRTEYYEKIVEPVERFKERLNRLEETCLLIEKFLKSASPEEEKSGDL